MRRSHHDLKNYTSRLSYDHCTLNKEHCCISLSCLFAQQRPRGFDAQGADRPQLLDAVMQLLDYEEATGEDLREMDYIPDDGSAAAAAEAAAAELEAAAAAAAAAAMAAETEAAAATGARGRERGGDTTSAEEFEEMEAVDGGSSASSRSKKKADKGRAASGEASEGWDQDSSAGSDLMDQSTVLGFAHNLGAEVLSTMKRDLNAVVGLLPAPVAKPIRDVAGVVGDITGRFAFPALKQAERYSRVLRKQAGRYTKVLRRHAGKAIGKAAVRVKEDYGPRMARGMGTLLSKGKRRLGEALGKAGKRDQRKKEGVEEGDEGEDEQ